MIHPRRFVVVLLILAGCSTNFLGTAATSTSTSTKISVPVTVASTSTSTSTTPASPDGKRSDERVLTLFKTVANDDLQPKSIVYSGKGLFFAQNMMYRHNVSVFDKDGNPVAKIDDTVELADFGIEGGKVKGSPVEAAFSPDGAFAYVSNYAMFGKGYTAAADDKCQGRNWEPSFVYRIDTTSFVVDRVIAVGAVPKFLAVSPNNKTLLVSNFCSQDVSVIDVATATETDRIFVGLHPRGIAITTDSTTAYIAVMGASEVIRLDMATLATSKISSAGPTPRHLVLSPDDKVLYVSNNLAGTVRAIDTATNEMKAQVRTGEQPRSMALSEDGASLYVVNYVDGTLSKIRTSDFKVIQVVKTGVRPVGVAYDPIMRRVWVANYSGSLKIYQDS